MINIYLSMINLATKPRKKTGVALALLALTSYAMPSNALGYHEILPISQVLIAPLFEYPVAPDNIEGLQDKSDWLMDHFWDTMDFKSTSSVDQNALNDAFKVYATAATYASKDKVIGSVNSMLKSLKGNPVLMLQFAKGAEESFYGPRADIWSDEIFIPFIDGVLAEKGISDSRKAKYAAIKENLQRNALGKKFPKLRLTLRDGRHKEFQPSAAYTLVEIGNPDCDDCKFAKMKLEMASDLVDMIDSKDLEMLFLVADAVPEDEKEILAAFKEYPENWLTGISYGADDLLDIRMTPTFYILGRKGEVIAKNLDISLAVDRLRALKAADDLKNSKKKK